MRRVEAGGKGGGEGVAVEGEGRRNMGGTAELMGERGEEDGVDLNRHKQPSVRKYVGDRVDYVLVKTVKDGFAGQKMVP